MHHRKDIDGLRSVAVLPIMLFHAGVDLLRGGYTGVDIFFVISGFLITSIILGELDDSKFSIMNFYKRRIARIIPAVMFVIITFGFLVGPVLVLPSEISEYFYSAAAASGFASNIYFWSQVDYFARAAESRPLLHTWSLGVEEQFYVFFPFILMIVNKLFPDRRVSIILMLSIVSLVAGVLVHREFPAADFYLLPFRAWELFIGALLALGAAPKIGPRASEAAALAGAGLIVASIFLLVSWLPFPSPFALAPCMGTALLIAYGEGTRVGRALSIAPLRWIGLVSFALYLWHWPIITLYREATGGELDALETIGLVAASFVAATVSYYLVEQPAREAIRRWSARKAVAFGAGASVLMVTTCLILAFTAEKIWHVSPAAERAGRYQHYKSWEVGREQDISSACFIEFASEFLDKSQCLTSAPDKRNVLLFGDSHAEMYGAALRKAHPEINWLQATHFGCPPVRDGWSNPGCLAMVNMVLDEVAVRDRIDGIVLADRWRPDLMPKLEATIALLKSKNIQVTVIGPVPEYQGTFPVILARAIESGKPESVQAFLSPHVQATDRSVRAVAERSGAIYYSVYETLCPTGRACNSVEPDGTPMVFDYGHLTLDGASHAIRGMKKP